MIPTDDSIMSLAVAKAILDCKAKTLPDLENRLSLVCRS